MAIRMAPTSAATMHALPANDHTSPRASGRSEGRGAGGSDGRVHLQVLTFLTEAGGPQEVAHRAIASLGLLPEVAWAELDDDTAPSREHAQIQLGPGVMLRVSLTDPDDAVARSMVEGLLILVRGVYTRELELKRLRAEACTDPLTGLWNRRGFEPFLEQALARSHRTGEQIAVMLCDIDRFKQVNDTLGHEAGDRALKAIAGVLEGATRPTDMAARLGGDEIVVLLAGAGSAGAAVVAERLRVAVAAANPLTHPLTLSIGIADTTDLLAGANTVTSGELLLRLADEALYRAKALGRDRVECHSPTGVPDSIEDEITETIILRSA